jgi:uncharacterized protein (TIGR03067 family)
LLVLGPSGRAATEEEIKKAVERAVDALQRSQRPDGRWSYGGSLPQFSGAADPKDVGATALAGLALLECGLGKENSTISRAADAVRAASVELTYTYAISLSILFLDRLGDPLDVPLLESLTLRLLAGQHSDGGWTYDCPPVGPSEVRRLKGTLGPRQPAKADKAEHDSPPTRRRYEEVSPEIKQQLGLAERQALANSAGRSDNSNTQFATLALWVGRRQGLPVERALARIDGRFRTSQAGDGGWDYSSTGRGGSTAMTCAGLLGLGVAHGVAAEVRADKAAEGKARKVSAAREPSRDPAVRAGLLYLGVMLKTAFLGTRTLPEGPIGEQRGPGPDGQVPVPNPVWTLIGAHGSVNYCLWSVERTAVAFGLDTIGKLDWYGQGADVLLKTQAQGGGWHQAFVGDVCETSFGLLFLRRVNLASDLTTLLRGRIRDPGSVSLRAGGVGAEAVKERKPDTREPEKTARAPAARTSPGLEEPTPQKSRPKSQPAPAPAEPEVPATETDRMLEDLVRSSPGRQAFLILKLQEAKGSVNTDVLARAIPRLHGAVKQKARDALAERMARMTAATLAEKLKDTNPEVRRAAALGTAMKDERSLAPGLIDLLVDRDPSVARAARAALRDLSGQDFGPEPNADRAVQARALTRWRDWWTKGGRRAKEKAPPGTEETPPAAEGSDQKVIQGTWVMTRMESAGKEVSRAKLAESRIRLMIAGGRMTMQRPGRTQNLTFTLDPSKDPREIDLDDGESLITRAIYQLDGDTLKICWAEPGAARPLDFTTDAISQDTLYVFQRVKPGSGGR